MPRILHAFQLALLLALVLAGGAAAETPVPSFSRASEPGLAQDSIHALYVNGDFDAVLRGIKAFQEAHPVHSRSDSLFIARHLAVVHAADSRSVEAGKYWMHRLLLLSPTADLSGMYVSEEIERTFERVRKESRARGGSGRRRWLWAGLGGATLAAAVTAWVVMAGAEDGPERTVVPVDL